MSSIGVFTDLYQNINENTMRSNIRNQQKRRSNIRSQKLASDFKNDDLTLIQRLLAFRFHPNKGFKLRWDLVIIILSIYNSIVLPLQFSIPKYFADVKFFNIGDAIIDILFLLDIFINFRTKYIDPKSEEVISDSKKIAINYL